MPLDPYFAHKLESLATLDDIEAAMADPATAAALAQAFKDSDTPLPPHCDTRDEIVSTREGDLAVRVYRPETTTSPGPGLVWVHGGGFAGGSIDMPESDTVARELAALHGVVVLTVDYSLCDGATVTYPVPHTQVADVFEWAHGQQADLSIAPGQLALGGASAGANLVAAAALSDLSASYSRPDGLVLVYPMVHRHLYRSETLEPKLAAALGPTRMNQGLVDHMYSLYTGGAVAPLASVDGHDLSGFPRTLTIVSEMDDLRPSGEKFHVDLVASQVDAELYVAHGMPHGHLDRTRLVPEVQGTVARMAAFLADLAPTTTDDRN